MEENIIKRLMTSVKCSVCGQRFETYNIDVLSECKDLWVLKASCPGCHTQCLVVAIVNQEKAPEVITDLTEAELDKFSAAGRVTADDVLDMHNLLKNFDGDFSWLFNWKQA